ncbi:uncharacterized protein LOC113871458 [Abrus precatorius]|uniref:Uncharacterized protein LOC113871458 n=1 Tax=Abrus precatorius TaxID=3816 RepID=A0A8B8M760_ABRPR|nr:uncharacterized protein LOC113871458 [Abrus precatorius]
MHRSASLNRFSDDYFKSVTSSPPQGHRSSSTYDANTLPTYDPVAELAKKELARVRFAENAVHVIPFVIFGCAIILWFFSNPDVGIINAKIEGLNLEGEIENDSDGTQTGILPTMNSGDASTEQLGATKVSIKPKTF